MNRDESISLLWGQAGSKQWTVMMSFQAQQLHPTLLFARKDIWAKLACLIYLDKKCSTNALLGIVCGTPLVLCMLKHYPLKEKPVLC